jgi:hypothetical protein
MTPNKRDLKAYSRFDGTGRIVPGSTVLRRNKPKNGKWIEVQTYECCNDVTLTFTPSSVAITDVTLRLFCNNTQINYLYTPRDSTTISGLISILNDTFGVLGLFSNPSGNIINLLMTGKQKEALCPVGTLTFDVVAD